LFKSDLFCYLFRDFALFSELFGKLLNEGVDLLGDGDRDEPFVVKLNTINVDHCREGLAGNPFLNAVLDKVCFAASVGTVKENVASRLEHR
jgi:hypothetical protein